MEELLRVERDGASNSSSSQALASRAESRIAKAVTPMKFRFMDEIVTDGVGQWRTYGPRGQVKGGTWKFRIFNFGCWIVEKCEWGKGVKEEFAHAKGAKVGKGGEIRD